LSTDQLGTDRGFEGLGREVKAEFGAQPAGSPRYVGFGVALLTFKTPIEEMRGMVTRALDLAEETGLPVFIELDDMNFMPEYSDASMVEWTAFPKPGETHGPRAKYYWLNWGNWQALPPPPNFESPAIRQEVSKRLKEGVLPPLLERLARWKKQKRQHLFAGVCVGWETGIPEYRSFRQAKLLPRDKHQQITMTAEEQGEQLGYASLHARGWTQQKIEEKARQSGQSVEDVTTELLFQVIHDYTAFWAKTVHDAGIAKERIYTHGVSWESLPDTERHSPRLWAQKSSRLPPVWVTVNPYSTPGYTVGSGMFEPKGLVRLLRAASATDGWGGVEAYVRGVESETAFGGYLRQLFDNGAQLVDIWGWTAPGTPYDPKRAPGALRAVHTWLEGKELPLTPAPGALPPGIAPSLQEKLKRLGGLFERQYMEGADMQPVSDLMRDFHPLLEQHKFAEAEALVDRALKLLGESSTPEVPAPPQQPGATPGAVPPSLQAKMARLQTLAQQRQQEGADMQPVVAITEGVQPLLDQKRFSEAEALADRVLKLLGEPEAPAPQQPTSSAPGGPPPSLQAKMARLMALAQQRQQEGADMQPVVAIADGIHPLLEQQKFSEAEALVDRALKLLGEPEAPTPQQQPTSSAPVGPSPSLQAKMARLPALAQQRQQEGADMQPVVAIAEGIQPLLDQKKFSEAEALVDRVLKLLGEPEAPAPPPPPGTASGGVPQSLQEKMARLQALAQQRQQEGTDLQPIAEIAQGVQPLMEQQKFSEAEALVDRVLKLLSGPAATEARPPSDERTEVLIAPFPSTYRNSAPGFKGITDAMDLLVENGMNVYMFACKWKGLEPAPGKFNLQEHLINPLTMLVPRYPQLKGVVLVLQMIDTNWRPMPADLSTKPFDDPVVLQRFDALIDAIAAEPCSKRITHILLGNEVDGYLGQHPEEGAAFLVFYKREVERIHQRLPGVKVGTIFTAQGATRGSPRVFDELNKYSDFVDFTYYPVEGLVRGNWSATWQMLTIEESLAELAHLVERAGNKPFSFTEIGYSASPVNNSSEEKQAEFVRGMFRVLDPYRKKGQIAFLLYHAMYDYPPGVCTPYAQQQGVPAEAICGFMENLGLRSYATGAPRPAWGALVEGVKAWNR
jgi:hypothetical protein